MTDADVQVLLQGIGLGVGRAVRDELALRDALDARQTAIVGELIARVTELAAIAERTLTRVEVLELEELARRHVVNEPEP